jgi:ornithine decarboxylase
VCFAIKANPAPDVLETLLGAGMPSFDAASLRELSLSTALRAGTPGRDLFLNPVKPATDIEEAYRAHGVRVFAADSPMEVDKLLDTIPADPEVVILIRIHPGNSGAVVDLALKYGCGAAVASELMKRIRNAGRRTGVTFHVGSQCWNPAGFVAAIAEAAALLEPADPMLSIGGGLPQAYTGQPELDEAAFFTPINHALADQAAAGRDITCEVGRALVAESMSLLLRVEAIDGPRVFLNGGVYGGLFESKVEGFIYPIRTYRDGRRRPPATATRSVALMGPTCDSYDRVEEGYRLPADLERGDYLELLRNGAYSWPFCNRFNSCSEFQILEITSEEV